MPWANSFWSKAESDRKNRIEDFDRSADESAGSQRVGSPLVNVRCGEGSHHCRRAKGVGKQAPSFNQGEMSPSGAKQTS
jgi:hypothetical protein